MIPVLDVTEDVRAFAPPGSRVAVSGGILALVDIGGRRRALEVLRGLAARVIAAWLQTPGGKGHQIVTTSAGNRFIVSVFDARATPNDEPNLLVIRSYAEACLAESLELDPEDVTVWERTSRPELLQ